MARKTEHIPTLRVTPAVKNAVDRAADELDRPVSWIMTDALLAWLREYQSTPDRAQARSEANG